MNSNFSTVLNASRWLAAFLVVTGHARHLILVDFQFVEHKTLFLKGIYFFTGLGHEAVVIFFVISGFLVGGLTLEKWQARGPNIAAYASARVSRIYTVLIPALLAGLILDLIGLNWVNASELYTNSVKYHTISLNSEISAGLNITTFVANLFMMEGFLTGTFGSNGPLWSLAYEWWYYCIFALVCATFTGAGNIRIIYAAIAVTLAIWLPEKLILWGTIWILGIVAHAWVKAFDWRPHPAFGLGLILVVLAASRLSHNQDNVANQESILLEFCRDFAVGTAFALAIISAAGMKERALWPNLHQWLAEFSYTTYLFHFPAMVFLAAFGFQVFGLRFQLQPGIYGLTYFTTVVILLYIYCFAVSRITESKTVFIRKKLDSIFRSRPAPKNPQAH